MPDEPMTDEAMAATVEGGSAVTVTEDVEMTVDGKAALTNDDLDAQSMAILDGVQGQLDGLEAGLQATTVEAVRGAMLEAQSGAVADTVVAITDEQWDKLAVKGNKALDMASNALYLQVVVMLAVCLMVGLTIFNILWGRHG